MLRLFKETVRTSVSVVVVSQTAPKRKIFPERTEYTLAINNGPNNLHSGLDYYDARLWNAKEEAENSVTFTLLSPDGSGLSGKRHRIRHLHAD